MKTIEVDVSALAPPEPMQVILSSLAKLPNDALLKVTHRREPFPLYERLVANGWLYHSEEMTGGSFVIYIANEKDKLSFTDFIAANTSE